MIAADFEVFSSPFCLRWWQIEMMSIIIKHQPKEHFSENILNFSLFYQDVYYWISIVESNNEIISDSSFFNDKYSHSSRRKCWPLHHFSITTKIDSTFAHIASAFFDFTKDYFSRKNLPISSIQTNQDARIQVSKRYRELFVKVLLENIWTPR